MRLIGVVSIPGNEDLTKKLPIQKILHKDYETKHKLYQSFRNLVKKGRYGLAITESKNMGVDGLPLSIYDTQLIEKENN
tara:strand:- start:431 stop:667 length:237 start_codon:yes stop_codon:yes gene_type:complete